MLRELTPERQKVGAVMVWCLEHAEAAEEVVECIADSLSILQTPLAKKVSLHYGYCPFGGAGVGGGMRGCGRLMG